MIIDSHVHAWNPETADTPWRSGWKPHAPRPAFGVDELLAAMDEAGVDAAAVIPPEWDVLGNELVLDAAEAHPDRLVAFPVLSLRDPQSPARLVEFAGRPGFGGLRQVFLRSPGYSPLTDGSAEWLFRAADELRLTMMVWLPEQLDLLPGLVDGHPGISFVVDHVDQGMTGGAEQLADAVTALAALADRPNLAVKVSALPSLATDGYPFRSTHRAVTDLVAAFGAERVFWGSDFTRLACSYREARTMMAEIDGIEPVLGAIMGDSFAHFTGFTKSTT